MKRIKRNCFLCISISCLIISLEIEGLSQSIYGIKVRDSNDQFLGLLVDALPSLSTNKGMTVYVPNINYPLWINADGNTLASSLYYKGIYGVCSGQPYVDEWRVVVKASNKFYVAIGKGETPGSGEVWNEGTVGCVPGVGSGTKYPAKEIVFPFAIPVSLPLNFAYDFPFGLSYLPIIQK